MGIISGLLEFFSTAIDAASAVMNLASLNEEIASGNEYAKAIFLWYYSKKPCAVMEDSQYPKYLRYECGIFKIADYHKAMIKEGYFVLSSNEEKLNMLKVPDLKNILVTLNLSATGKKNVLIQRILENVPFDYLRKILSTELFSISEKGLNFLAAHKDCIKLYNHSNLGITWHEYYLAYEEGFSFYDTVYKILNQRIVQDKYNSGRREYYRMYELLEEEGKRSQALEILLRVFYLDLNTKSEVVMILPAIITAIAEHADVFSESMIDMLYRKKSSKRRCNKKLFTKFITEIINNTFDEIKAEKDLTSTNAVLNDSK